MGILIRPAGPVETVAVPGVVLRPPSPADTSALGRLYFASYEPGVAAATEAEAVEDIGLSFEGAYGVLDLNLSRLAWLDDQLAGAILVVERASGRSPEAVVGRVTYPNRAGNPPQPPTKTSPNRFGGGRSTTVEARSAAC